MFFGQVFKCKTLAERHGLFVALTDQNSKYKSDTYQSLRPGQISMRMQRLHVNFPIASTITLYGSNGRNIFKLNRNSHTCLTETPSHAWYVAAALK